MEGILGIFTFEIPQEITVFLALRKRGVGLGQNGKKRSRLKIFKKYFCLVKGSD
jgi:hypothetical protein